MHRVVELLEAAFAIEAYVNPSKIRFRLNDRYAKHVAESSSPDNGQFRSDGERLPNVRNGSKADIATALNDWRSSG